MTTEDRVITLQTLKAKVERFVQERNWERAHVPKNLAMSIAIEAAELMEHFQWNDAEVPSDDKLKEIRLEVADIMIYLLSFCTSLQIDLASAVTDKMDINQKRFPKQELI